MSKITPGPWRAFGYDPQWEAAKVAAGPDFAIPVCDCFGGKPAVTRSQRAENAPVAEANAKLMAAAPDLLRELQEMVETFQGYQGMELKSARAAISRATGETE